jgi:hypothetical protein
VSHTDPPHTSSCKPARAAAGVTREAAEADAVRRYTRGLALMSEGALDDAGATFEALLASSTIAAVQSEVSGPMHTHAHLMHPLKLLPTPLAHSLTHSLTRSLTHSPTHPLNNSPTHSLTHLPTFPRVRSLTHLLTHPFTHSRIHSLIARGTGRIAAPCEGHSCASQVLCPQESRRGPLEAGETRRGPRQDTRGARGEAVHDESYSHGWHCTTACSARVFWTKAKFGKSLHGTACHT